jgi:hypothetical protein
MARAGKFITAIFSKRTKLHAELAWGDVIALPQGFEPVSINRAGAGGGKIADRLGQVAHHDGAAIDGL